MEFEIFLFLWFREKTSCYYSSFIFLVNVVYNFLRNECIYGLLFLLLFITSQFFYTYNDRILFLLDQIAIYMVILYGFLLFLKKEKQWVHVGIVLNTFFTVSFLYHYGYYTDSYCYGSYGDEWQSFLHLITCIGHLAILFM